MAPRKQPETTAADGGPLWTDTDVSEYFAGKIKTRTLANWRASGDGPPFLRFGKGPGSTILYRPEAVKDWARQQEKNNTHAVA